MAAEKDKSSDIVTPQDLRTDNSPPARAQSIEDHRSTSSSTAASSSSAIMAQMHAPPARRAGASMRDMTFGDNTSYSQRALGPGAQAASEHSSFGDGSALQNHAVGRDSQASLRDTKAGASFRGENVGDSRELPADFIVPILPIAAPAADTESESVSGEKPQTVAVEVTGDDTLTHPHHASSSSTSSASIPDPSSASSSKASSTAAPQAQSFISGAHVGSYSTFSSTAIGQATFHYHAPSAPKDAKKEKKEALPAFLSSHLPPAPVEGFVGRVELLETLAREFGVPKDLGKKEATKDAKASSQPPTKDTPRRLVLCGLGGIGKTQLALHYAHTATKFYNHKFWFVADSRETLALSYRQFAKEKGLLGEEQLEDMQVIQLVHRWLSQQSNWLVIYDNVERYEDVAPYLPTQRTGHVLLTSRLAPIKWPKSVTAIAVDVLSIEEANQLIASLIDTPEDPDIPKLSELLGCLPLALVQASAYIRNQSISIARYLELYAEQAKVLLSEEEMPPGFPAHDPVFITWNINLIAIAKEEEKAKPKAKIIPAKKLLQFCAYLSSQKIPHFLLEAWHQTRYPEAQESLEKARGRLHAYSLIQLHPEDQSIKVHRLAQQVMREQLPAAEQQQQLTQTLQLVNAVYPEQAARAGKAWDAIRVGLIPHLEGVISHHGQQKIPEDVHLAVTLFLLDDAYSGLSNSQKQRTLLERALKIFEEHYGPDHQKVAATLNNLANAHGALGDAHQQRALLERVLKIKEAHYGPDHWQVVITLNGLANAHGDIGDAHKKHDLLERALKIAETHYGSDHWQVAITLNGLANAYGDLGDARKKRDLLERALKIFEAHYGPDHWQVAIILDNLANAHLALENTHAARPLLERALKIKEAHYGPDHWQVAITLENNALGELGDAHQQRALLERALKIFETHYGPEHPETAKTLTNLALVHKQLGDISEARHLEERALKIEEAYYGLDHYETAHTRFQLAITYLHLKEFSLAQTATERALAAFTAHYGSDHARTQEALKLLSRLYDISESSALLSLTQTLTAALSSASAGTPLERKQTSVPSSIATPDMGGLQNLIQSAGLCLKEGNLEEAIELYEQVLETASASPLYLLRIQAFVLHNLACAYHVRSRQQQDEAEWLKAKQTFERSLQIQPEGDTYCEYAEFLYLKGLEQPQENWFEQAVMQCIHALMAAPVGELIYTKIERDTLPVCLQTLLDTPESSFSISPTLLTRYLLVSCYCHLHQAPEAEAALDELEKLARMQSSDIPRRLLAAAQAEYAEFQSSLPLPTKAETRSRVAAESKIRASSNSYFKITPAPENATPMLVATEAASDAPVTSSSSTLAASVSSSTSSSAAIAIQFLAQIPASESATSREAPSEALVSSSAPSLVSPAFFAHSVSSAISSTSIAATSISALTSASASFFAGSSGQETSSSTAPGSEVQVAPASPSASSSAPNMQTSQALQIPAPAAASVFRHALWASPWVSLQEAGAENTPAGEAQVRVAPRTTQPPAPKRRESCSIQ